MAEDGGGATTYALPEASNKERIEQEKLLQEYELRRKAKSVVVPTDDGRVRQMLRQINEPITLFGEKEVGPGSWAGLGFPMCTEVHATDSLLAAKHDLQMERRERLRRLLAQQEAELAEAPAVGQLVVEELAPAQVSPCTSAQAIFIGACTTCCSLQCKAGSGPQGQLRA